MTTRTTVQRRAQTMLQEKGFETELHITRKFDFIVAHAAHPFTSHKLLADLRRELEWTGFDAKLHKTPKEGKVEFRIFPA